MLAAIAVFSLSIAMALGVLALSMTNNFLLMPPTAEAPDRLVMIYGHSPDENIGSISYPDYKYYRENNHVFTDVAAAPMSIQVSTNSDNNQVVKVVGRPVSDNYFSVMGVQPYLGRFFSPGDDNSKTPIAVATYACWKRLSGDPNFVGKKIGGYTIVGVARPDFTGSLYGLNGDLLISLPPSGNNNEPAWFTKRDDRQLSLIARLKPGVTRKQAQVEMSALSRQLAVAYPKEDKDITAVVTRATMLPPGAIPDAELIFGVLMGLVLLVLLIACANVANALLAVAIGRRYEASIKLALGVRRSRLVREFLAESTTICAASAVLGYVVAAALLKRYPAVTVEMPMLGAYSIGLNLHADVTVAAFTVALMLIAILATGLAPALYASSPDLAQVLNGEIVVGGRRKNFRRSVLVVVQVAISTVVLVGMGLCERSLYNLRHADTGFSARNLVAVTVYPPEGSSEAKARELYAAFRDAVRVLPGVESVSLAKDLPLVLGYGNIEVRSSGNDQKFSVSQTTVDENYFSTFGIPLVAGRVFNSGDREKSPNVAVINHKLAETLWPGQDPLGRTIETLNPPQKATVVGVTVDGKYGEVDEAPQSVMYSALSQHYLAGITAIARTSVDPHSLVGPLDEITQKQGMFHLFHPITFTEWSNFNLLVQRVTAGSVAVLSMLGLVMAMLGLFGAISYSVSERKKEFGIRVALGAERRQLLKMILRETAWITGIGVVLGLSLGIAATTLLRSQFYGISSVEWFVLLAVSGVMMAVSLVVAWVSARPWMTADPLEAVRHA
jgi:predicted permease